jgi:flagellar basal body-associated protein FliL
MRKEKVIKFNKINKRMVVKILIITAIVLSLLSVVLFLSANFDKDEKKQGGDVLGPNNANVNLFVEGNVVEGVANGEG